MSTRLSAEELDRIEVEYHNGVVARSLMREVRASWADVKQGDARWNAEYDARLRAESERDAARAESVRLREALRGLLDSHWAHRCSDNVGGCTAVSWEKFCDAWDVLHPENPSVDYDYDKLDAAARALLESETPQ